MVLLQVFITPMPLLRAAHAMGLPHLRNLDEAVSIMRGAMLDVIQVCSRTKLMVDNGLHDSVSDMQRTLLLSHISTFASQCQCSQVAAP
jgi:hypothetical protein